MELLALGHSRLGPETVLDFGREIVYRLRCPDCETEEAVVRQLGSFTESAAQCATCGRIRVPDHIHYASDDGPFGDATLSDLGIPRWDILTLRNGMQELHIEMSGDRQIMESMWR